jgi:Fe-S-cluster containining protein
VFQDKWWEEGLPFTCTGCGKCCQNDGEVWFNTDEFYDLSLLLDKAFEDTINEYMETISFGWLKAKNKISNDGHDSCVFLGPDGKTCTVYKARPTQCRTYPYWPDLLVNKSTWDAEAVVPDMMVGKHWTKEGGGCEGINHPDALIIPKTVISRNQDLYKRYTNQYTLSPSIQLSSDRNRLISKLEVIKVSCRQYFFFYCCF